MNSPRHVMFFLEKSLLASYKYKSINTNLSKKISDYLPGKISGAAQ